MAANEHSYLIAEEAALTSGPRLIHGRDDMNAAAAHALNLLRDAALLLEGGSAATAAFLAITAMEEVAKTRLGFYRRGTAVPRRRDPLYRHATKHLLALAPTLAFGSRLPIAIGEANLHALLDQGRSSGFVDMRESCLYFDRGEAGVRTPGEAVTFTMARALVLLAIEVFDDSLVGYTHRSFDLGEEADRLFVAVAALDSGARRDA